jgi:hypothetical protein
VADAFVRIAEEVGIGRRYDAIVFEYPEEGKPRLVRIDSTSVERLVAVARRPAAPKEDTVVGVLVEADFESFTARLRGPGGSRTQVQFPPELADEIKQALREPARLRGEVRYDPTTEEARAVELRQIVRGEQLALGLDPGDFWTTRSVGEIAEELGIAPIDDVEALRDGGATEEEVDQILAALEPM